MTSNAAQKEQNELWNQVTGIPKSAKALSVQGHDPVHIALTGASLQHTVSNINQNPGDRSPSYPRNYDLENGKVKPNLFTHFTFPTT